MSDAPQTTPAPWVHVAFLRGLSRRRGVDEASAHGLAEAAKIIEEYGAEMRRLRSVLAAARGIRHWHDRSNGGMVVSAEHVHALWAAIAEHDKAMGVTDAA